ncbi:MAG: SCO family protein [Chthoniobacterales bacterium]|nr:SCO family protein [Chthoniobacterales bacterium]
MSAATTLAPTRAPLSWRALAWKATLILIPLLTAAGLFFLRQAQVARLSSHELPKNGIVPSFQLIDQDGGSYGSQQLLGKIWIADFVYSTCPGPCPMISSRMGELQKPLRDTDVKLVSFSVDPQHDTPAVLRDYADKLNAQPGRWHFLTGDKDTIYRLAREGFRLATMEGEVAGPIHSTRMVLIDRSGTIRGYYDATDADAVTRLLADTNHLRREQPVPATPGSGS